jgi:hypothetical protein
MHYKRWNQRRTSTNMASVSEDQNADSSATQCTTKERLNQRKVCLCRRIRNADSLQYNALQTAGMAQNKLPACVRGSGMLTPLQHSALQERWNQRRTRLASVSEDQMLTPQRQCTAKERWKRRRTNTGICVRGSGMLTPLQHNALQERWNQRRTNGHLCQRIRNADSSATQCTAQRSAGISAAILASVSEDQEC